jgi:hypothetical protein
LARYASTAALTSNCAAVFEDVAGDVGLLVWADAKRTNRKTTGRRNLAARNITASILLRSNV